MEFFKYIATLTNEKLIIISLSFIIVLFIFKAPLSKILPLFVSKFLNNGIEPHKKAVIKRKEMDVNKAEYIDAVERVIFEIPISRKTVLEFNQNVVVNNRENFLKQLNIVADYHRRTGMAMTYGLVDIFDHNKLFEKVFFDHIRHQIEQNNILIKIIFPNTPKFEDLHMLIESHIKRTGATSVKLVVDGYRRKNEITPVEKRALKYGNE